MKNKTIYKTASMLVMALLLGMCSKSSDDGFTFTSKIITEGSVSAADQTTTTLWFSVDGGAYTQTPILSVGKKFKVKVRNDDKGFFFNDKTCYKLDWSESNPKPDDVNSENPEFTMVQNTAIVGKMIDIPWTALDINSWTGDWIGSEGVVSVGGTPAFNGSDDKMTIVIDPSNTSNGLIIDNFFGDNPGAGGPPCNGHVTVHFTLSNSTDADTQIVTVPAQTSCEGADADGTGTYDQCTGTMEIAVNYDVYSWTYSLSRP